MDPSKFTANPRRSALDNVLFKVMERERKADRIEHVDESLPAKVVKETVSADVIPIVI